MDFEQDIRESALRGITRVSQAAETANNQLEDPETKTALGQFTRKSITPFIDSALRHGVDGHDVMEAIHTGAETARTPKKKSLIDRLLSR